MYSLLAAYELGATATRLQEIFDVESKEYLPIFTEDRNARTVVPQDVTITRDSWREYVGLKNDR